MICLRCGYCCKELWVMIVNDPDKGIEIDNIIEHKGQGNSCKQLQGNVVGEYSCAIHDKEWYDETPCNRHGQIESSPDTECRMGRYQLDNVPDSKSKT